MAEKNEAEKPQIWTRNRIILAGVVLVMVAVATISVVTNVNTMYERWEQAGAKTNSSGLQARQLDSLEVVSGTRRHRFQVEVMKTDADRARGLMYRRSMPPEEGMLFDFGAEQNVSMWMKNTFIALDMIFIRADGRIHRIEQRTEPESEKTIASGAPVKAVLEVNSGVAIRLNLKPGDYIIHPIFK